MDAQGSLELSFKEHKICMCVPAGSKIDALTLDLPGGLLVLGALRHRPVSRRLCLRQTQSRKLFNPAHDQPQQLQYGDRPSPKGALDVHSDLQSRHGGGWP